MKRGEGSAHFVQNLRRSQHLLGLLDFVVIMTCIDIIHDNIDIAIADKDIQCLESKTFCPMYTRIVTVDQSKTCNKKT